MNNQAAQTMPAMTPKRCSFFLRRFKNEEKMLGPNEQLALDYAIAALSQTAGVPDPRHSLQCDDDGNGEYNYNMGWNDCRAAMLAAAPAASGGERPEPDARCNCGWGDIKDHLREECTPKDEATTTPPPDASVSERARALLVAECPECGGSSGYMVPTWEHGGAWQKCSTCQDGERLNSVSRYQALRALEQALTQQRGDDVESAACALFEAQADPLAASWDRQWEPTKAYWRLVARGYHVNADGVLTQPAYVSVHCGLADFTDYFVKNYPGPDTIIHDPKWHAPRIFGAARRAIMASPEYAAATTPQPSADAVRELVERWRSNGHPYVSDCADELESLLSGGSNA